MVKDTTDIASLLCQYSTWSLCFSDQVTCCGLADILLLSMGFPSKLLFFFNSNG